jgi:hypothetical protein
MFLSMNYNGYICERQHLHVNALCMKYPYEKQLLHASCFIYTFCIYLCPGQRCPDEQADIRAETLLRFSLPNLGRD